VKHQTLQIVALVFMTACTMIGGVLGLYIYGLEPSEYALAWIGGPILGGVTYLILSKWNKKRNGNVPNVDERTIKLMQRYLMIVLYIVLFGSAATLLTLYAMGVHSIETIILIVYLMGLFILIGLGAIVTKHL